MQAPKSDVPGIVVLLPVNKLGMATPIKRGRGRPRKIELRPTASQQAYAEAVAEAREKAIAADPLVVALQGGCPAAEALHTVKVAMSQEAAALGVLRREHEARGLDVSQLASRRVAALSMLANVTLEITKLAGDGVDLGSDRVKALFEAFAAQVEGVAVATLPPEVAARLVDRFRRASEEWEEKIQFA